MTTATTTRTIALTVNGLPVTTAVATMADLLSSLGHDAASVATACNGDFVPRGRRALIKLAAGDRIEIVSPRQGG